MRSALERTLALVTDVLGLRSGWVWLIDPETHQFYNAASYNLPPYLQEPVRMSGTWCICTDGLRSGQLMTKNVDVIECSRLSPAVRDHEMALTAGLRFHASVPLRFRERPLGVMNVTGPKWRKLTAPELELLNTIALHVGAMIERSRLAEDEARLARAQERTRMARDLHDTLLQSLTAIALQLESAAALPDVPREARERIASAVDNAHEAAAEARRAIAGLRAAAHAERPLAQALAGLARTVTSETGVAVTVEVAPGPALPATAERELYRIVHEALTNVRKHARAKRVAITMRRAGGGVRLSVADDGVGLERPAGSDAGAATSGQGVRGMEERAALLGGKLWQCYT